MPPSLNSILDHALPADPKVK